MDLEYDDLVEIQSSEPASEPEAWAQLFAHKIEPRQGSLDDVVQKLKSLENGNMTIEELSAWIGKPSNRILISDAKAGARILLQRLETKSKVKGQTSE